MEYERIHKVQTGMVSPSKLRMKLIGVHNQKKKDESKSNNNSSRTSPARMEDSEFVKNTLLAGSIGDFVKEATSLEIQPIRSDSGATDASSSYGSLLQSKDIESRENGDVVCGQMQVFPKGDGSNSSLVHPVRTYEDESLDYDSTSSFEFYKGERSLHQFATKSLSRPMPSKWNDAEKWIMNTQIVQSNVLKKTNLPNQMNRPLAANSVRVALASTSSESKPCVKRVDFCQPASQTGLAKLAFAMPISTIDTCPDIKDLPEVDCTGLPCCKSVTEETRGIPTIRSVSMRDMGTEMTPIPSQEPSRSATPITATTPLRSPTSSIPSTPRGGDPAPAPSRCSIANNATTNLAEAGKKELSEQELKLKTRREIVDLGVQLGKMNIAAWASKDEKGNGISGNRALDGDEVEENAKRAVAWEEAEKSKHAARFKREEIRIQAWESRQRAKVGAEMKKVEAQIEQMRAQAQAKMVKKIALARQKSNEKRAAAEDRRNKQAEKTAAHAEQIRQTGRIPSSSCCGWI